MTDYIYTIQKSTLTDIANAIRSKRGTSGLIEVADFEQEILAINPSPVRSVVPQTGTWQLKTNQALK